MFCIRVHLQIMFDQPDDALRVIGWAPGGNVLQGLLLLILFGELGELKEQFIHLLDGKDALGTWRERLALLKEDSDYL